MQIKLHKNAKTTLAIKKQIRNSKESIYTTNLRFATVNWEQVENYRSVKFAALLGKGLSS